MWAVALLALIDGSVATNATSTTSSAVSPTPTPSPTMRFRAVYGSGGMKTWAEAQKQCQAWNGSLAKVDATDSTVKERLKKIKCSDVLWVGAQESPKAKGVNKDGWKWISDGSKVSTETWRTYYGGGEPNNYGDGEDCVFVDPRGTYNNLNDQGCEKLHHYVCGGPTCDGGAVGDGGAVNSENIGAIIGGAVGGAAALGLLLIVVAVCCCKKKKQAAPPAAAAPPTVAQGSAVEAVPMGQPVAYPDVHAI